MRLKHIVLVLAAIVCLSAVVNVQAQPMASSKLNQNLNANKTNIINRSYELFKVRDRLDFKLKCDFIMPVTGNQSSTSNSAQSKINWFKLDPNSVSVKQFNSTENSFNNYTIDISNYMHDIKRLPTSINSNLILKYESDLKFKFKTFNYNNMMVLSGVYLCKLNQQNYSLSQQNFQSQHQYLQKISVNEMLEQEKSLFQLNYSIIQITSTRVVLEINAMLASGVFFSPLEHTLSNYYFKLIYSLVNSKQVPIFRGIIDAPRPTIIKNKSPSSSILKTPSNPIYIVFEGLNPNNNYSLSIYLKTNLNIKQSNPNNKNNIVNFVQLISNITVQTKSIDSVSNSNEYSISDKKPAHSNKRVYSVLNDPDYSEDDDDEDDYDDDYTSYGDTDQYRDSDEYQKNPDRVINCDISKATSTSTSMTTTTLPSQILAIGSSLFANVTNKKKPKRNQFITINYSSSQMSKLMSGLIKNLSINQQLDSYISTVSNYKDFFNIQQFNKKSFDYVIHNDCLKQLLKQTSSSISFTEPLCLLNTVTQLKSADEYDDYDYDSDDDYQTMSSVKTTNLFSVQTSIVSPVNPQSFVYIASSCQMGSLLTKPTSLKTSTSKLKQASSTKSASSSNSASTSKSLGLAPFFTSFRKEKMKNLKMLPSSLINHHHNTNQTLFSLEQSTYRTVLYTVTSPSVTSTTNSPATSSLTNSLKYYFQQLQQPPQLQGLRKSLTSINDCQLLSDNQLQFQIENYLNSRLFSNVKNWYYSTTSTGPTPQIKSKSKQSAGLSATPSPSTDLYYHVEILIPNKSKSTRKINSRLNARLKNRLVGALPASDSHSWVFFKFKIENNTQVVRVNLTNIYTDKNKKQLQQQKTAYYNNQNKLERDEGEFNDELKQQRVYNEDINNNNNDNSIDVIVDDNENESNYNLVYENTNNDKLNTDNKNKNKDYFGHISYTSTIKETNNNNNNTIFPTKTTTTIITITNNNKSDSSVFTSTTSSGSSGRDSFNRIDRPLDFDSPSSFGADLLDTYPNSDYVFKIKILSEDNTQLAPEFELNVDCKKMNNNNISNQPDGNNSFVGLVMTSVCAIIIVIVGFLFCLIMKRKYGLSPEYFFNLKNNALFKSAASQNNINTSVLGIGGNQKRAVKHSIYQAAIHHHNHHQQQQQQQQQQYQLQQSLNTNLTTTNTTTSSNTNNKDIICNMSKNPTFNYNYVRLLKQKWHNSTNNTSRNEDIKYYGPIKCSITSKNNKQTKVIDENSDDTNSINYNSCLNMRGFLQKSKTSTQKHDGTTSNNNNNNNTKHSYSYVSSSLSSSPLVLISTAFRSCTSSSTSTPTIATAPAEPTGINNLVISDNHAASPLLVPETPAPNPVVSPTSPSNSTNPFSYYSTSFTNSIRSKLNNLKNNLIVYKEDNDAIGVEIFEDYVQKMHVDGDFGFAQLYEEITAATKAYSFSSEISLLECNRCKNRYSNILTYDHSRVKLTHDERDESSGYINANYVDGYQKSNAYIATQGPMPNTFADFWKMIWEKNCSIIVMITNVKEKGRIKCDQYWPDDGFEFYGNIQVTHLHTISLAFYTKRIFTIKIKNAKKRCPSERLVYQFHFTDWPDHGVPYYIMPVLTFIKKSSRSNPEFGGPIVVHCSAGVGRTGTYIVIDAMMKQILHKSTINIHTFLKHIRHQRNYLVQTEEQFIFIYDVLLESIKSGETELNEHNFKSFINNLSRILINDENNSLKLIDRQFELITEFKPKDYHVSFANMPFNMSKNRNQRIIPVNNSRVILSKKPGVDGSEYINATYLHGSTRQDEFIITQYPMEETKCNFWQMVWDNNSNQIVVLNSDETENCDVYWLPVGEAMKCDSFTVMLKEENFDMDFVLRDFLLQSIDEDYEFNCRMITACYWPDSCTPVKTSFELINKVKIFRMQSVQTTSNSNTTSTFNNFSSINANLPPIIVHDLYGGYRAATFCALYTFQDLIQLESSVNVYELAKMYHLKRPEIWNNRNNIMFLYEAVESLFEEMHLNHQYQFKNYLNINIDNHFNNLLNSNYSNMINSSIFASNSASTAQFLSSNTPTQLNNHISLSLLPTVCQTANNSTVTLPHYNNSNNNSFHKSSASTVSAMNNYSNNFATISQAQRNLSNDAVGTRLHNFQSHLQQTRTNSTNDLIDPSSTIPLTATNVQKSQTDILNKSSLIDIPRILPSFLTNGYNSSTSSTSNQILQASQQSSTNDRRSTNSRNSKARKFMNTMMLKSASFKRALFSQSLLQSGSQKQSQSQMQDDQQIEQKPSVIVALSSASSSEASSSSTSALSSTMNTATESTLSSKTAFMPQSLSATQQIQQQQSIDSTVLTQSLLTSRINISTNNLNAPTNISPCKQAISLSREKLTC